MFLEPDSTCCGLASIYNFPYAKRSKVQLSHDLQEMSEFIADAREYNFAVLFATTTPAQKGGAQILKASGFRRVAQGGKTTKG